MCLNIAIKLTTQFISSSTKFHKTFSILVYCTRYFSFKSNEQMRHFIWLNCILVAFRFTSEIFDSKQ